MIRKLSKKNIEIVLERDNYSCIICQSNDLDNPHHAFYGSQANRGDDRNEFHQLVCICKTCHKCIHFGGKNRLGMEGQYIRGECIEYLKEKYTKLPNNWAEIDTSLYIENRISNSFTLKPLYDYTFEIPVDKLIPHQNNIKYTRYGAFKTQKLKDYQEIIQTVIKSQFMRQQGKLIDKNFIKIEHILHYKIPSKKSFFSFEDLITVQRGDYGNIVKSVDDCLQGIVIEDDKQIIDAHTTLIPSIETKIIINITRIDFTI